MPRTNRMGRDGRDSRRECVARRTQRLSAGGSSAGHLADHPQDEEGGRGKGRIRGGGICGGRSVRDDRITRHDSRVRTVQCKRYARPFADFRSTANGGGISAEIAIGPGCTATRPQALVW